MKKLLTLLLALCLAFTSLSALAEAAVEAPVEETPDDVPTEVVEMTEEQIAAMAKEMIAAQVEAARQANEEKRKQPLPEGLVYQDIISRFAAPVVGLITMDDLGVFQENDSDILFVSAREYYTLLAQSNLIAEPLFTVEDGNLIVSRDNGSSVTFIREGNRIYFSDLDLFNAFKDSVNGGDVKSLQKYQTNEMQETVLGEDGQPLIYLLSTEDSETSYARTGSGIMGSFDDYEIPVYWTDDDLYLPIAVMNNICGCGSALNIVYLNGCAYTIAGGQLDSTNKDDSGMTMADYYYAAGPGERSESLAALTYNVLCMELDLNYGLKSAHGIGDSFDEFFETVGLADGLKATDGQTFHNALTELTRAYFCDFHSAVEAASPFAGQGYKYQMKSYPSAMQNALDARDRFINARVDAGLAEKREEEYHEQEYAIEAYREIGDTAYVTFDCFYYNGVVPYYSEEYKAENYCDYDTISLIVYAHSQITRENSPIRKVVLDLSCNGGGAADTALYVVSWMLGDCKLSTTDPTTSANYTVVYKADVDLDGRITENDSLQGRGLKLYCLTSPVSFSCGNLVPCLFKESGKVVLLGQTSGGGACVVHTSVAADGTIFCYSGNRHICTVKNGSYYSVDQGAAPDFTISDPAHFYDREWLTDFIANLP